MKNKPAVHFNGPDEQGHYVAFAECRSCHGASCSKPCSSRGEAKHRALDAFAAHTCPVVKGTSDEV